MNLYGLAKKEFEIIKWIFLVLIVFALLTFLNIDPHLQGFPISSTNFGRTSNYFFETMHTGNESPFLFMLIVILATCQFYGNSSENQFLFSLPIKKKEIIKLKLLLGIATYSLWIFLYGLGLIFLFTKNLYWLKDIYSFYPVNICEAIEKYNSVSYILKYLLMIWLSLTTLYFTSVIVMLTVKNKIIAAMIVFILFLFPEIYRGGLNDAIYYSFNMEYTESLNILTTNIYNFFRLFTLQDYYSFNYICPDSMNYLFNSTIKLPDEVFTEYSYHTSVTIIEAYTIKLLICILIIPVLGKIITIIYKSYYINEENAFAISNKAANIYYFMGLTAFSLLFSNLAIKLMKNIYLLFPAFLLCFLAVYFLGKLLIRKFNLGKWGVSK